MPWQQHVADVALETDPDTGRLVYRDVRLTVPRQSGKTTLVLPVVVWRALAAADLGGRQNMVYAAQTRQKARKKWERDYVVALRACPAMRRRFEVRLANGDERVTFVGGSTFGVEATTEKAGHGETLDMPILDEAFAQIDDRMDQAFRPPMVTRPSPQFWITSTAGTPASLYLRRKVDEGRAAVEAGLDHGMAYFEWSADPDADPRDPATWWSCMPALGHTVTEETIAGEITGMDPAEFARAYLNMWSDEVVDTVIPLSWWSARTDLTATITGSPVLAIDVAPLGSHASVVIAGESSTVPDAVHLELVDFRDGTDWLVDRVVDIADRRSVRAVALDDVGPAAAIVQALRARGIEPLVIGARGMRAACGGLYDAARDVGITHLGDPIVTEALKAAVTRQLGDAWAWRRRTSTGDITSLVAFTIARWAHFEAPEEDIVPLVAWR